MEVPIKNRAFLTFILSVVLVQFSIGLGNFARDIRSINDPSSFCKKRTNFEHPNCTCTVVSTNVSDEVCKKDFENGQEDVLCGAGTPKKTSSAQLRDQRCEGGLQWCKSQHSGNKCKSANKSVANDSSNTSATATQTTVPLTTTTLTLENATTTENVTTPTPVTTSRIPPPTTTSPRANTPKPTTSPEKHSTTEETTSSSQSATTPVITQNPTSSPEKPDTTEKATSPSQNATTPVATQNPTTSNQKNETTDEATSSPQSTTTPVATQNPTTSPQKPDTTEAAPPLQTATTTKATQTSHRPAETIIQPEQELPLITETSEMLSNMTCSMNVDICDENYCPKLAGGIKKAGDDYSWLKMPLCIIFLLSMIVNVGLFACNFKKYFKKKPAAPRTQAAPKPGAKLRETQAAQKKEVHTKKKCPSEKSEKSEATSPKNTKMREKLLETQANLQKIRAHMKKNALQHKSDTRTSKFKKMGPIFIPMEPDILNPPVLPTNVVLDKVWYDPTANEMYDIGSDVDDIELDTSFMVDPSTMTEEEATKKSKKSKKSSKSKKSTNSKKDNKDQKEEPKKGEDEKT